MTITRIGANKTYSDNWENIFGGKKSKSATKSNTKTKGPKSAKKKVASKPGKKSAVKKTAKKASRRK